MKCCPVFLKILLLFYLDCFNVYVINKCEWIWQQYLKVTSLSPYQPLLFVLKFEINTCQQYKHSHHTISLSPDIDSLSCRVVKSDDLGNLAPTQWNKMRNCGRIICNQITDKLMFLLFFPIMLDMKKRTSLSGSIYKVKKILRYWWMVIFTDGKWKACVVNYIFEKKFI